MVKVVTDEQGIFESLYEVKDTVQSFIKETGKGSYKNYK
ncbi:Uncharacterised protein [Clostridium putrefaciens]|uniref:Uncharacterized protein n=1 Tax=Clostridium putrefaciens TaxID=99675 RepID=A0A381J6G2_9CLOT|nr:Uncharacterised protein [Clostridium putrefaciens]